MSVDSSTNEATLDQARIVDITDEALAKVLEIRADEDEPDSLQLRVEVTGVNGVDYTYDLAFEETVETNDADLVYEIGDLRVVVPTESADKLRGSVLDLPGNPMQGGLVLRNPNRPNPLDGVGDLDLHGELPEKVQQLLDQSVNPALASHGGVAALVGVDDDNRVFVTMGGGCQGCSLSAATLREGITRAITEALPEVTEVIDATDHEAGENPYY
jgi:Fe/S biogenesis protein NfuA